MLDPDVVASVTYQLEIMKVISGKMSRDCSTQRETGGRFPIPVGYSKSVRRPIGEAVKWMKIMEDTLEMIMEELSKQ